MQLLSRYQAQLHRGQPWKWRGHVVQSVGATIESTGLVAEVGECCEIVDRFGNIHLAEVIGFRGTTVLSMPVESADGIRYRDPVAALRCSSGNPGRIESHGPGPGCDGQTN